MQLTGPEAIEMALRKLSLDDLEAEARGVISAKKKTARPRAVRILRIVSGLRKNNLAPADMLLRSVPVIPPRFRPFSVTGTTFLPGDANEMYRDVLEHRRLYQDTEKMLGKDAAMSAYADMAAAVKAAYGYGESPNPKIRQRSVKGFLDVVTGSSPKTSFMQSKMLSKPMDSVGRGVIIPDADYGMDEVGIPVEMAWPLFGRHVQRRMVIGGMSPASALKHVKDRTPQAVKALHAEVLERPVVVTRSPAWHRTNVVGQYARLVDGDAIRINTFITEGQNADFDGDQCSVHVPATPAAVKDIQDKIMASRMQFSIKDRTKTMGNPKHEDIIGLTMGQDPGGRKRRFASEDEAMKAIESGAVDLNDDIELE